MQAPSALIIGSGEYVTGYVAGGASTSDKGAGVVALSMFELRRRGRLRHLAMAGTQGRKFPGIRAHLREQIAGRYGGMDTSLETYPADEVASDPLAYRRALDQLSPGDVVMVFTPDDTHFAIAMAAVARGCHVLVAKPLVKTVEEHRRLAAAAAARGVLVAMEVHKRWDPIYADARDRIRGLGGFSFFQSYMSQPKSQLETFRAWAGKASDISYYLNSHHVDFHHWAVQDFARPMAVSAMASTGVASGRGIETEDTVTLATLWQNLADLSRGTAVYSASWIAPPSDVHSQQRFFYVGHGGEISVDQAHRGYTVATDRQGLASPNPLFMKYTPDARGQFAGHAGYGYRSIEAFVDAAVALNARQVSIEDCRRRLATATDTLAVTAILEAGRRSLDSGGHAVYLDYADGGEFLNLRMA
jgi:D-galacturonate reductase